MEKKSALSDIVLEIKRRSRIDSEFRALALKNPDAAIKQITTTPLPTGVSLRFVDNSGPVKTFTLPDVLPEIEQLSDLELEEVAGGDVGVSWRR
jgi:hypothetical protein